MTRDEALALARARAAQHGWPFVEPVQIERYRPWWLLAPRWRVVSNHESRGSNVRVEIDERSGAVVHEAFLPR